MSSYYILRSSEKTSANKLTSVKQDVDISDCTFHFTKDYLSDYEDIHAGYSVYVQVCNFIDFSEQKKTCLNCGTNRASSICRGNVAANYITVALNSFHVDPLMQNWFCASEHSTTSKGMRNVFLSEHNPVLGDCFVFVQVLSQI